VDDVINRQQVSLPVPIKWHAALAAQESALYVDAVLNRQVQVMLLARVVSVIDT